MTTTYLAYIPSPPQGVWHLSFIPIRAYALFIVAGIVVALMLGDRRWVARGGQAGVIYDIALLAVPFGLIGGRLYHVITDWRTYFGDDGAGLLGAFRIWDGGLGIWGAVALGGVGAWIGCRYKGIPLPAFGDAIAPGIILAQAIGRVGNYFNQELYGRPTTLPWGLEIYERVNANGAPDNLNGVSTGELLNIYHPTFLYELLWNVLIFAALIYIDRRFKIGHGRLFAMYVAGYCFGRFWIELMRSDYASQPFDGIRVNSLTSTFVFIGAVVYIMVAPKGREDPASLAGKPEEDEDTVETFAKELTAVAATTGVVAAAKAAGDAEDEDAKDAVEDEKPEEPDEPAVKDAEAFMTDVPAESVEEAEEFAAEGEAEPEAGLGEVEGEEAVEALAAAPEAHEAAVEAAEEAEAVADEVAAEDEAEEPEAEAEEPEAETEDTTDVQPEAESAEQPEAETAEPEAGLGAVEGEEAVEALEAAPDVHDAAVEAADEAEAVADEVAAEEEPSSEAAAEAGALAEDVAEAPSEDIAEAEEFAEAGEEAEQAEAAAESEESEPDEPETEDAEAAVEEAEAEPSVEEAAEEAEAVVEEADSAAEDEPTTGVLEAKTEPEQTPEPAAPTEETGGRLRRWLRRDR
ncbi:MAG TPA: prolipoprotein diacylglyceryl transferase [Mycobacterium sp.]|nr:prolipoprotein diacylglyceryl transferase [Mycobacterium sp.]